MIPALNTSEKEIDFREFKNILLEKKWQILFIAGAIFVASMLYSLFKPERYQASVLLEILHTQQSSLGSAANSNTSGNTPSTSESVSVQSALIYSKYILEQLINSLALDIEIKPTGFSSLLNPRSINNSISMKEFRVPSQYLNKSFQFSVLDETHYRFYLNKTQYIDGKINQALSYNGFNIWVMSLPNNPGAKFLITKYDTSKMIAKLRALLTITDLSNPSEANVNKSSILQLSLIGSDPESNIKIINELALISQEKDKERKSQEALKTLQFLTRELPLVYNSLKEAEAKLNAYRSKSGKIDLKLQTQFLLTHLADIDKQIVALQLKEMDMSQQYTLKHPFIIALNQKQAGLIKQRQHVLNQIKNLPAADQLALNLTRDVSVKNVLYMNLLSKIQEQKVITSGIVSDIRILSFAKYSDLLAAPKLTIIGFASFVIGILFASLFFIALHLLRMRVQDPTWIERHLFIPNLITLPYSQHQFSFLKSNNNKIPLLCFEHPHEEFVESLRFLRTLLSVKLPNNRCNIISFMSITPGVGKSFISANLAALLSMINYKVLIIDCDIRNRSLVNYFPTSKKMGLVDILHKNVNVNEAKVTSPYHTHLDYIGAGCNEKLPPELYISNTFKEFLSCQAQYYQYIILNAPALTYATENATIGTLADMNLLVVASHLHSSDTIKTVVSKIHTAGVIIHGSIFNHTKFIKSKPIATALNKLDAIKATNYST